MHTRPAKTGAAMGAAFIDVGTLAIAIMVVLIYTV